MATKKKAKTSGSSTSEKKTSGLNGKTISKKSADSQDARDTARLLLEIEAIHCRPDNPYIFTSGRASPVYIDCRKLISFPEARTKIMNHAFKLIGKAIGWNKIDVVAGGETAGIPFAAFLAALATCAPPAYALATLVAVSALPSGDDDVTSVLGGGLTFLGVQGMEGGSCRCDDRERRGGRGR